MQQLLVDSSFFVSIFLDNDVNHIKSLDFINNWKYIYYVTQRVIEETSTVITYKRSKMQSNYFFDFIKNDDRILILEDNHNDEIEFYNKLEYKISFIDSSLIFQSMKFNIPILSYDKELLNISKLLNLS